MNRANAGSFSNLVIKSQFSLNATYEITMMPRIIHFMFANKEFYNRKFGSYSPIKRV